jgi:hypothetical protein
VEIGGGSVICAIRSQPWVDIAKNLVPDPVPGRDGAPGENTPVGRDNPDFGIFLEIRF